MYIHKVPTLVSLAQLEDEAKPGQFCSPDEPIRLCAGRILPTIVYPFTEGSNPRKARSFGKLSIASIEQEFARTGLDGDSDNGENSESTSSVISSDEQASVTFSNSNTSLPEKVLCKEWDRRSDQGLFRYDVKSCETKVTEGVYGFVAQLNEGRASKKRATEFCVDKVVQPFDGGKFNFQKASMKEVLFQFTTGAVSHTHYHSQACCTSSPNLVLINVSPIEYGHVLLVPRVNDCIPQIVDQTSMLFALQCAMEIHSPFFRLGYNSLGAFGTINHLHFQGYFLEQPYPVEIAPIATVAGLPDKLRGVHVDRLKAYPVHGWVFSGADNVDSMASVVGAVCMQLQVLDVPHNLLICDMGSRVILWPQCFAAKQAQDQVPQDVLDTGVNPAAFEIAGHMVLKRREDYEAMTQECVWEILQHVSLSNEEMESLQAKVFAAYMTR
eukprot:jgi/Ulvmu1/578/UM001_0586.1